MSWRYRRRKRRKPLTGRKRKCPVCKVPKYTGDMVPIKKCWAEGFSDWMCKDCFAEEKRKFVYITPELPVTRRVEKQLRRQADKDIPTPLREWFIPLINLSTFAVFICTTWALIVWVPANYNIAPLMWIPALFLTVLYACATARATNGSAYAS